MIIEIANSVKIILTEIANEINDIIIKIGIYIINKVEEAYNMQPNDQQQSSGTHSSE